MNRIASNRIASNRIAFTCVYGLLRFGLRKFFRRALSEVPRARSCCVYHDKAGIAGLVGANVLGFAVNQPISGLTNSA